MRPGAGVEGTGTGLKSPHPAGNVTIAVAWSPTEPTVLASGCKPGSSSGGGYVAVWDVAGGTSPLAKFKIPGEVLHIAWHPDGEQFAAVCPRQARDEVYFFQRKNGEWEQRQDIMMGGAGIDLIQEVSEGGRLAVSKVLEADTRSTPSGSGRAATQSSASRTTDR